MRTKSLWRNIRYKLKARTGYNLKNKNRNFFKRQLRNIIICIIIVLVIVIIKSINTKPTEEAIKIVKNAVNYTVDIKKDSTAALNFIKGLIDDTRNFIPVFNNNDDIIEGYIMPVSGKIYQPFGEVRKSNEIVIFNPGIKIMTLDITVMSIQDGLVSEVRDDKLLGKTIVIIHDEISFIYGYLNETLVSEGQTVKKEQEIGRLNNSDNQKKILYLEVREKGNPINPLDIIKDFSNQPVLR